MAARLRFQVAGALAPHRSVSAVSISVMLGTGLRTDRPDGRMRIPSRATVLLSTDGLVEGPGFTLGMAAYRLRRYAASLAGQLLPCFCDEVLARCCTT
ncbi:hypothetical protein GCM10022226_50960 [Sphaerisporangium flaviroseum]|uniref:PPM-type phosphatase domain-containing protein n=2 Tax=Sphaerisporangium flaviroseum TaxID=509199 RepID=A0ABP7IQP0_9ACTN